MSNKKIIIYGYDYINKYRLVNKETALNWAHHPTNYQEVTQALRHLKYEEALAEEYAAKCNSRDIIIQKGDGFNIYGLDEIAIICNKCKKVYGFNDVKYIEYHLMKHEILAEENKNDVFSDIVSFFNSSKETIFSSRSKTTLTVFNVLPALSSKFTLTLATSE